MSRRALKDLALTSFDALIKPKIGPKVKCFPGCRNAVVTCRRTDPQRDVSGRILSVKKTATSDYGDEFFKRKKDEWCLVLLNFVIFRLSPAYIPADIPDGLPQALFVFHKGDPHIIFASFTKSSAGSDGHLGIFHKV